MREAHDLFSETNPAFCAYGLVAFVSAFCEVNNVGAELPLAYVVLPIVLSGDMAKTFDGTNKKTGLIEWLERSPQIQLELAGRVNGCASVVTEAVRFGAFSQLLALDDCVRLKVGSKKLNKRALAGLSSLSTQALKRAERFGHWCGAMGSTRQIFNAVGLTV